MLKIYPFSYGLETAQGKVCVHAWEGGRERRKGERERGRVVTSDEEDGTMQSDNI